MILAPPEDTDKSWTQKLVLHLVVSEIKALALFDLLIFFRWISKPAQ